MLRPMGKLKRCERGRGIAACGRGKLKGFSLYLRVSTVERGEVWRNLVVSRGILGAIRQLHVSSPGVFTCMSNGHVNTPQVEETRFATHELPLRRTLRNLALWLRTGSNCIRSFVLTYLQRRYVRIAVRSLCQVNDEG